MTERRRHDRSDAVSLVVSNPGLSREVVRLNLGAIRERGFARGEDLDAKLEAVLAEADETH